MIDDKEEDSSHVELTDSIYTQNKSTTLTTLLLKLCISGARIYYHYTQLIKPAVKSLLPS